MMNLVGENLSYKLTEELQLKNISFSFEKGTFIESCCAVLALRSRVRKSATGSVIVILCLLSRGGFQTLYRRKDLPQLVMPGTGNRVPLAALDLRHRFLLWLQL